ncbi:hypothetical protein NLI96_g8983 [Meripilus lineatus]|uniref:Uncharacterized protein n=1 Tax=Meripilus lineatus TaxID=2056292 RepID=A0AAD5UYL4_9APHY|nr:hypothetical protein NLI96_g8983 [Physisporinus lineatus]
MLHDPTKQGWHFCKHASCCYASPQKSVLDEHVRGVHGSRELIFCTMRTEEHGGATSKTSPRLTAIEGREGQYTIPNTFKTKIKLKLPPGIHYEDEVPPLSSSPPMHSPPTPIPSLVPPPTLCVPSPLFKFHHSDTPSKAPPHIPTILPQFSNPWSHLNGLELLANTADIYGDYI